MIRRIIFLLILVNASLLVSAQQEGTDNFYEANQVDSLPKLYVNDSLIQIEDFIYQYIRWKEGMNEGEKVALSYLVDTNGYIVSIELLDIPKHCELCLKEFVRVITSLPRLKPAYKDGIPVNVKLKQVFYFNIQR